MAVQLSWTSGNDNVLGTSKGDRLYGMAGNDIIQGFIGKDTLYGGNGDDWLYGGNDADFLQGNEGSDRLFGGLGADTLVFDNFDELIWGCGNDDSAIDTTIDVLTAATASMGVTINLTENRYRSIEKIIGSIYGDTLTGNDVATILDGGKGNDFLTGGQGNDSLLGGDGVDWLMGSGGNDTINGGTGNDTIVFDPQFLVANNTKFKINGGAGSDWLDCTGYASSGVTVSLSGGLGDFENIAGTVANDMLTGNAAINWLYGYDGNDRLEGGGGKDVICGGNGDDTIIYDKLDSITGGAGEDVFVWKTSSAAKMDLNPYTDIENALSAGGRDILTGNSLDNVLDSGAGDDTLLGGIGNDTLIGGLGNDKISGNEGADVYQFVLSGGKAGCVGMDTLIGGNEDIVEFWGGTVDNFQIVKGTNNKDLILNLTFTGSEIIKDKILLKDWYVDEAHKLNQFIINHHSYIIDNSQFKSVDATMALIVGDDNSNLALLGSELNDSIRGYGGNDVLNGLDGDDTLDGGEGNDIYFFNRYIEDSNPGATHHIGNDVIVGSTMNASDKIEIQSNADIQTVLSRKHDDLVMTISSEDSITIEQWFTSSVYQIPLLVVNGSKFTVSQDGASLVPWSEGGAFNSTTGDDNLTGTVGNDSIDGLAGNDSIYGKNGNDTLYGGADNDLLYGGAGNDVLFGNEGADVFGWNSADGYDVIKDFNQKFNEGGKPTGDVIELGDNILSTASVGGRIVGDNMILQVGEENVLCVENWRLSGQNDMQLKFTSNGEYHTLHYSGASTLQWV